jgi:hypothetical protein
MLLGSGVQVDLCHVIDERKMNVKMPVDDEAAEKKKQKRGRKPKAKTPGPTPKGKGKSNGSDVELEQESERNLMRDPEAEYAPPSGTRIDADEPGYVKEEEEEEFEFEYEYTLQDLECLSGPEEEEEEVVLPDPGSTLSDDGYQHEDDVNDIDGDGDDAAVPTSPIKRTTPSRVAIGSDGRLGSQRQARTTSPTTKIALRTTTDCWPKEDRVQVVIPSPNKRRRTAETDT